MDINKTMIEMLEITCAVSRFADLMRAKMLDKYAKGYRGWDDIKWKELIEEKLKTNLEQEDYIDVANLAMMLHRFQQV